MVDTYRPQPEQRESSRERTVRLLADEATKLRPRFTLLTGAAWQAIRNARVSQSEQRSMHAAVMAELGKRGRGDLKKRRAEESQLAEARAILEQEKRRELFAQAYRHEKNQPADAYDADAEEDARRSA